MSGVIITTKYLGPTNHRGSRITAKVRRFSHVMGGRDSFDRLTLPYDCGVNSFKNHAQAAMQLAARHSLVGAWHEGESDDGCGYVFVRVLGSSGGDGLARHADSGTVVKCAPESEV